MDCQILRIHFRRRFGVLKRFCQLLEGGRVMWSVPGPGPGKSRLETLSKFTPPILTLPGDGTGDGPGFVPDSQLLCPGDEVFAVPVTGPVTTAVFPVTAR